MFLLLTAVCAQCFIRLLFERKSIDEIEIIFFLHLYILETTTNFYGFDVFCNIIYSNFSESYRKVYYLSNFLIKTNSQLKIKLYYTKSEN